MKVGLDLEMVDRDSLKAVIGVIWTVVITVDSWSAMIAVTGSTTDASPKGITTSTGSTIDTACSGTACGSGRTVLITILTTIAGGCANEPSPLAAHIGGAATTTVSATTKRSPLKTKLYVGLFFANRAAATSRSLKRIKSQDISFQAGMIRR